MFVVRMCICVFDCFSLFNIRVFIPHEKPSNSKVAFSFEHMWMESIFISCKMYNNRIIKQFKRLNALEQKKLELKISVCPLKFICGFAKWN